VVRPTVPADLAALPGPPLQFPSQCVTLVKGDEVLAIGGIRRFDGVLEAWARISPEARRHPIALHKAARGFHEQLKRQGIRKLFAVADPDVPASDRWLERHGFTHCGTVENRKVYQWQKLLS
jgi:L-amino acid N-acyltransferase YncA